MANRIKEDERNEKIIRGLLKLPENRRCINCNSLGPQYVCTNFWTFICTTCSGIHREYTHRVKSVSMAKFTSQEVNALQGGGNERAREVYFKDWESQRHSLPDSSNVEKLRDFIRHVYVDRRYTGERSIDKPPRVKMGEKEDSYENRRVDTSRGGSRSPPYDDTYDRRYSERSGSGGRNDDRNNRYNYDERRSPGYDQESRYGSNYRKSPVRFEVVDDRRRDDRFGNGRKVEEPRYPDGDSKSEGRSPNRQIDIPSPPMVRPVREILGDDVPPLRVGEPPRANGGKAAESSARTQRTASSSSLGSNDGGSVEIKRESSASLIDFSVDPEPSAVSSGPPTQSTTVPDVQPVTQTTSPSVDGGNWASFDFAPQAPAQPPAPSTVNTLESLLFELSTPASAPVVNTTALSTGAPSNLANSSTLPFSGTAAVAPVGNIQSSPNSSSAFAAQLGDMMSTMPSGSGNLPTQTNDVGQWPNMQQSHPSLFAGNDIQSSAPQIAPIVQASSNQTWNTQNAQIAQAPNMQQSHQSLFAGNDIQLSAPQIAPIVQASSNQTWSSQNAQKAQAPSTTFIQPLQPASNQFQETSSAPAALAAHPETKKFERQALPEDLFAMTYPSGRASVPGWHAGHPSGMGYGMQYPTAVNHPMQALSHPSKPSNPFDITTEPNMVHAISFPSMTSLQGALPNQGGSSGLLRSASVGNHSQQWMPPQSQSYASPGQSPSYASALPQGPFMPHQVSGNMQTSGNQGNVGLGGEASFFGNLNTDQQQAGRYSLPATPNSFSSLGGNPFE